VTAAGRYVVVVYAPEQAANMAEAQGVLGDAAIVNLRTGAVKDLGGGFSIAYFDPGCGTGSDAVLTRGGWANDDSDGPMSTTLVVADAATGKNCAAIFQSDGGTGSKSDVTDVIHDFNSIQRQCTRSGQFKIAGITLHGYVWRK